MRLQPKRTSFRKRMKGMIRGTDSSMNSGHRVDLDALKFGSMGLIATECARLTARQLESSRRVRRFHMARKGKVWTRIFPDIPVSNKPSEVRMGKGKGAVAYWACKVRPGTVLFEVIGVPRELGRKSLELCAKKLPMKTVFKQRDLSVPAQPTLLPPSSPLH